MTNARLLRPRHNPPPQAAEGSVNKELLDVREIFSKVPAQNRP